ncbi:DNA-binding SARP family transcriptional activator [Actinokineospora cianjurensis]|uniref:DNA-binding SARP family transcriptional activator n=2 Tax=Actinokineospora cianjurensis TaxID=585224 RepID=A0A421BBX8_9PSEU|nr:DNA-binding SARP family transcriptional activator [Actinokineospora cianjurensis]
MAPPDSRSALSEHAGTVSGCRIAAGSTPVGEWMRFGVLGALMATDGVACAVPSAPKSRQLLALLMIDAGEFVPVDRCIAELWSADPPKTVMSTLQTYVFQIRRLLRALSGADRGELLVTRKQGYQLLLAEDDFDAHLFAAAVLAGRDAVRAGDDLRGSAEFERALRLWRGPVLADVAPSPSITAFQVELTEHRRGVLEQRIEADLRLGRHAELVGELRALVEAHPTHENTHAQLMVALHRCGRTAESLRVYERLGALLGDQLGMLPSPRLQRLCEAVRTADAVLAPPVLSTG